MSEEDELREKKLRGSGGFVYAKVTDEEQKKGNLGGPELFLAGIGRLPEERFSKYFCNKCEKDYKGSPSVRYENPNEDLGEGVILAEKGEYRCATCSNTIAQYRKFDQSSSYSQGESSSDAEKIGGSEMGQILKQPPESDANKDKPQESFDAQSTNRKTQYDDTASIKPPERDLPIESQADEMFHPIQSLVGLPAYDNEALLIGKVQEIGLRKPKWSGNTEISIKISRTDFNGNEKSEKGPDSTKTSSPAIVEISWREISKIGDIVLISTSPQTNSAAASTSTRLVSMCSCGHKNERGANFCEECGNKL